MDDKKLGTLRCLELDERVRHCMAGLVEIFGDLPPNELLLKVNALSRREPPGWVTAILREREHQHRKHGNHEHEIPSWICLMRAELDEAEHAWRKGTGHDAMRELLQAVAVGVAAIDEHGVHERERT